MPDVSPLQIDWEAGVAVIEGRGFTVAITLIVDPAHEFAVGVTVYVAFAAEIPELLKVCAIELPELAEPPVIPPA